MMRLEREALHLAMRAQMNLASCWIRRAGDALLLHTLNRVNYRKRVRDL